MHKHYCACLLLVCLGAGADEAARTVDGAGPAAALLFDPTSGDFVGTTTNGGQFDQGTLFAISPQGEERVLHSFAGAGDGANPLDLIRGRDGSFYGTTAAGGLGHCARSQVQQERMGRSGLGAGVAAGAAAAAGCGTLFALRPNGEEIVLHLFSGLIEPGGLLEGSDGNLYGTGPYQVFKLTRSGEESVLHTFHGGSDDGIDPSSLIEGPLGNLYGTTQGGGQFGRGTVFVVSPSGEESLLYSFKGGRDGELPSAPLILGRDGNFYGTTAYGGAKINSSSLCDRGCGTVFRITPSGAETVLHTFGGGLFDGANPSAGLIEAADGYFYGATSAGGSDSDAGSGTVFRISPGGAFMMLYAFGSIASHRSDAVAPTGLIQGRDGSFYGTAGGGRAGQGVVFKVTPAGVESVLHSFSAESRR